MRIAYAILCKAVELAGDGTLYVLGGDFDTITFPVFPAVYPSMSLAVRLSLDLADLGRSNDLRITLAADGADRPIVELGGPFVAPSEVAQRDRRIGIGFAPMFQGITFPREGEYTWRVSIDGVESVAVPLYVDRAPSESAAAVTAS